MAWEELDLFQRELCLQGKWQQVTRKKQELARKWCQILSISIPRIKK